MACVGNHIPSIEWMQLLINVYERVDTRPMENDNTYIKTLFQSEAIWEE